MSQPLLVFISDFSIIVIFSEGAPNDDNQPSSSQNAHRTNHPSNFMSNAKTGDAKHPKWFKPSGK